MIRVLRSLLVALVVLAAVPVSAATKDYQYRQYGASTSIWFSSLVPALNAVYAGGFGAGESQISKDGAAFANTTNLPTYLGNGIYNIVLTATEMQASYVLLSFIDSGAANTPDWVQIDTKLDLSKVFVGADTLPASNIGLEVRGGGGGGEAVKLWSSSGNANGVTILGLGTGVGMSVTGGATGAGLSLSGGATSGEGMKTVGTGTSSGITAEGGATNGTGLYLQGVGTGRGLSSAGGVTGLGGEFLGGTTSGTGLYLGARGGNSNGAIFAGMGTQDGLRAIGGTTGNGINAQGGATGGSGIGATANAGNGHGFVAVGNGTSDGIRATGGATGNGIFGQGGITSGTGIVAGTQGGNSNGFLAQGIGTQDGIRAIGGDTGNGINGQGGTVSGSGIAGRAVGGGHGFNAIGVGSGNFGFAVDGFSTAYYTNIFSAPYSDITGAPNPGTTSIKEGLGALVGRFYNKVTQTSTTQTIFKSDSVTTAATCTTSDNGVTQTKGKCN